MKIRITKYSILFVICIGLLFVCGCTSNKDTTGISNNTTTNVPDKATPTPASAPTNTANHFSVSGQVNDRFGNPLPGANVTLVDNNYDKVQATKTDSNGRYAFTNVTVNTDTCRVLVSYTDPDGMSHLMPDYYTKWFEAKGTQSIPSSETYIPDYPAPTYGYLYGAITTSPGKDGQFISGIVYLLSQDTNVKYYLFADRTDGKGSFYFYAPSGQYWLYAQHWANGMVYESVRKQVTIKNSTDPSDPNVMPVTIVLPLGSPTYNPDPREQPVHNYNNVSGVVQTKDGRPWPNATVTLLEQSDITAPDGHTNYIPMRDTDGKTLTTTTGINGTYRFYGVIPTTDDNKAIEAMKYVKVMVNYTDVNGTAGSYMASNNDTMPMYYPDMIMGYGQENKARNIMMPAVTLPFAKGS